MSATAEGWLAKADNDLDSVRRAMIADPATNNEAAAYHLQQAPEKLLKAALVHDGTAYPRGSGGHDLQVSANRLSPGHPLFTAAQALAPYTPWATAYRYPEDDPWTATPVPTDAEIEAARRTVTDFRDRLVVLITTTPPASP